MVAGTACFVPVEICDPAESSGANLVGAVASTAGTLVTVTTWQEASCDGFSGEASVVDVVHGGAVERFALSAQPRLVLDLGGATALIVSFGGQTSVVDSTRTLRTIAASEALSDRVGASIPDFAGVLSAEDPRHVLVLSTAGEVGIVDAGSPVVALSGSGVGALVALTSAGQLVEIDPVSLAAAPPIGSCRGSFVEPFGPSSVLVGCGAAFQLTDLVTGSSQVVSTSKTVRAGAGDLFSPAGLLTLGDGLQYTYPLLGPAEPPGALGADGSLTDRALIVSGDVGLFILNYNLAAKEWSTFVSVPITGLPNEYVDDAAIARISSDEALVAVINLERLWVGRMQVSTATILEGFSVPSPLRE